MTGLDDYIVSFRKDCVDHKYVASIVRAYMT